MNENLDESNNSNQRSENIQPFNLVPITRKSGETPRIMIGAFDNGAAGSGTQNSGK
jgi:hypothetical protein